MSIKHFCDLPLDVIRTVLSDDFVWKLKEKFDGSYIRAGVDAEGRFYTTRKDNKIRYSVEDWDLKHWTNGFRSAHLALESFADMLMGQKDMKNGDWFEFEIIEGTRSNSIEYSPSLHDTLVLIGSNVNLLIYRRVNDRLHRISGYGEFLVDFSIEVGSTKILSVDGHFQSSLISNKSWKFCIPTEATSYTLDLFPRESLASFLNFFDQPINCAGFTITMQQALEIKLNKRPTWIDMTDDGWKTHRPYLVSEMRRVRDEAKRQFEVVYCINARCVISSFIKLCNVSRKVSTIEGIVAKFTVNGKEFTCKFVDKEYFSELNTFTHIVKYWLVGGRRPPRPCFESRTKDWPKQKRLDRLDQLLARYHKHKSKLGYVRNDLTVSYEDKSDLDRRAKNIFAELRQRIIDGRDGI